MRSRGPEKWSEKLIQEALYCHCAIKRHELIVPNSKVFGWESDMISVTKSGLIFEYEIKISRSDFLADAKKKKAEWMQNPVRKNWYGRDMSVERPNHFFYVTPPDLVKADELPAFAGLMYSEFVPDIYALFHGTVSIVVNAPKVHSEKISEWQRRQLFRATTVRYWRERINGRVSRDITTAV